MGRSTKYKLVPAYVWFLWRICGIGFGGILLLFAVAAQAQQLVFYGDESFPPYEFPQDGVPRGANVDLLHEIGRLLNRPVEVRLTSWSEAQARVRDGTGSALSLMARTPEREAIYGFSEPTFPMTYSLFVPVRSVADFEKIPLSAQRIGVTSAGLPRTHFEKQHPEVTLVIIADYADGVRRLLRGEIDALAAATWTGNHFLHELNISGITHLPKPFAERIAGIAVPRANTALLAEIDRALLQLKSDGTFDRITDRWGGARVHIFSENELWLTSLGGAALAAAVVLGILLLLTQAKRRALSREIAKQKETEAALRASEEEARSAKMELEALAADLERRVEERTAQLIQAQKMEAVGQLTSGVAHDFNNVLQGVAGCLAALENRTGDEVSHRLFSAAQQGIERGARLTQHLLSFARRQTLTPRPTNIATMLDGMRPLLERSMGGLIQVSIDTSNGAWRALVDPTQLEVAIVNLAINSRDAMPYGGMLTVCVADIPLTDSQGAGAPESLAPGDYVMVSVTDNGIGMDAATLARVYEPFFTTKDVGKGSGLGLSMVHGMAAQSGGGVAISSQVGQGTTVSIYLPRAVPVIEKEVRPVTTVESGAGRVVVLVDDDDLVRTGAQVLLEGMGYRVIAAESGMAALEVLRSGAAVDVLVTDYAMPNMSGAVLIREARQLAPTLPVLVMTGYVDHPEGLENIPLLRKPFRPADLSAQLAALANGNHSDKIVPMSSSRTGRR